MSMIRSRGAAPHSRILSGLVAEKELNVAASSWVRPCSLTDSIEEGNLGDFKPGLHRHGRSSRSMSCSAPRPAPTTPHANAHSRMAAAIRIGYRVYRCQRWTGRVPFTGASSYRGLRGCAAIALAFNLGSCCLRFNLRFPVARRALPNPVSATPGDCTS